MLLNCLKCRNIQKVKASKYAVCDSKKSATRNKWILSNLRIKTLVGKSPLLGNILF